MLCDQWIVEMNRAVTEYSKIHDTTILFQSKQKIILVRKAEMYIKETGQLTTFNFTCSINTT